MKIIPVEEKDGERATLSDLADAILKEMHQ
jgi:hypothetical protein